VVHHPVVAHGRDDERHSGKIVTLVTRQVVVIGPGQRCEEAPGRGAVATQAACQTAVCRNEQILESGKRQNCSTRLKRDARPRPAVASARICSTRFLGAKGGRCIGIIGMVYPGTLFHRRQRGFPMHSYENRSQIRALARGRWPPCRGLVPSRRARGSHRSTTATAPPPARSGLSNTIAHLVPPYNPPYSKNKEFTIIRGLLDPVPGPRRRPRHVVTLCSACCTQ
jgi:hypothetical protein